MSDHPLAGTFSVDASARLVRHYRYAEERMMRALGGWIALTPELHAKLLFGRHVWDCAQHADLWGRRLPELRAPAQQSEPPNAEFVTFMNRLESREGPRETVERLVGVYRVLKPHLVATYAAHLGAANPVYEPPTRRILERCVAEERRHVAAAAIVLDRLRDSDGKRRADAWQTELLQALAAAGGVTGRTPNPPLAADVGGVDGSSDVVVVPPAFEPGAIEGVLRTSIDEHCRAIIAGDVAAQRRHLDANEHAAVLELYAGLPMARTHEIVAQAKIGAHRVIKVRLHGPRAAAVLQLEWHRQGDDWRVVKAEVVAS